MKRKQVDDDIEWWLIPVIIGGGLGIIIGALIGWS